MEEAGAVGAICSDPISEYSYDKVLGNGKSVSVTARLYLLRVSRLTKCWTERDQRRRRWFSFKGAANPVNELSGLISIWHFLVEFRALEGAFQAPDAVGCD